jgi:acyl-CoA reductase-like NAD-dependent aldehyde dehydrogenase
MSRLEVLKTYKIFIGGKFPRTESGRYYQPMVNKKSLGNICLSSRKDFKNAVVAARSAQGVWRMATAYNRSQILYRISEVMEGRKAQFIDELQLQGLSKAQATKEVELSIDRWVYFAGWCDKFTQVFSSVNPVASSHFNFSTYEPSGVVSIVAPQDSALIGLVTNIAATIAGGNTCIVLASENMPLCAITLAEVFATSDVPGGVINILTGSKKELLSQFASHMDVNAMVFCDNLTTEIAQIQQLSVDNLKRIVLRNDGNWSHDSHENPYYIIDLQEVKTTWHPIELIGGAGSGY